METLLPLDRPAPAKEGFLSGDVELLDLEAWKRVCTSCCPPVERNAQLDASSLEVTRAAP